MEDTLFREPHWLRKNHGQRMPGRVMTLAFDFAQNKPGLDDETFTYRITKGAYHVRRLEKGRQRGKEIQGNTKSGSTFESVYGQCTRRSPLLVLVASPRRDFGMAGFYQELQSKRIVLYSGNGIPTKAASDRPKVGGRKDGFAWLERDKGVSVCWHEGRKLILLGIGNFVEFTDDLRLPCEVRAKQLMDTFQRYLDFLRENNCGGFAYTCAAQSMRSFRHSHKHASIHIHGNRKAYDLEGKALRGGREQLFYFGHTDEKLYQLDVSSMYGFAMRGHQYPAILSDHQQSPSLQSVQKPIEECRAIASVRLKTQGNVYPYWDGTHLIYPEGYYTTVLAGPELRQALLAKEIVHVGEIAVYRVADLFTNYVDYWWSRRIHSRLICDDFAERLSKVFLSCMWGKWGQKGNKWIDNPECRPHKDYYYWFSMVHGSMKVEAYRNIGLGNQKQIKGLAAYDSFSAIAAYVTSFARLWLDKLVRVAGYHHCYLVYVDSLIVDSVGLDNLQRNGYLFDNTLGSLRIQSYSQGATFHGPGDYTWAGSTKICGVPKEAREIRPGVFRFFKSENSLQAGTKGSCYAKPLQSVEVELRRPRPVNFVRENDWLGPLVVNEGR